MNKSLLYILLFFLIISNVSAVIIENNFGGTFLATDQLPNYADGLSLRANFNTTLINVTRINGVTFPVLYVFRNSQSLGASTAINFDGGVSVLIGSSTSVVGNDYIFTAGQVNLTPGYNYLFVGNSTVGAQAVRYINTRSLPYPQEQVNFTHRISQAVAQTDNYLHSFQIIRTENITAPAVVSYNITYDSIYPSNLTDTSLFSTEYFNMSYIYNNSNMSSPYLNYSLIGGLSCYQSINGTCVLANNTLVSISPSANTTTGGLINLNYSLEENDVYSYTANLPGLSFNTTHIGSTLASNNFLKQTMLNVSNVSQYNILEIMSNSTGLGRVYACNSSYTTGNVLASPFCMQIGLITTSTFNHSHGQYSQHNVVPFNIINGRIGGTGIRVTSNMSFLVRGDTGTTIAYYVSTNARTGALSLSSNNGNAYTNIVGTLDLHLHQYTGYDYVSYSAGGLFSGGQFNSSILTELIDVVPLPPTAPLILIPNYNVPAYKNFTYSSGGATILEENWTYTVGGYSSVEYSFNDIPLFPLTPLPSTCNLSSSIIMSRIKITGGFFPGTSQYCINTSGGYTFLQGIVGYPALTFNGSVSYPQILRFMNITWTPSTSNTVGGSIARYVGYLLNNDSSLNRTIFNQTTTNFTWDVYAQNLTLRDYYTQIYAYDSSGLTNYNQEAFRLLYNSLLNITALNNSVPITVFSVNVTNLNTSTINRYTTTTGNVTIDTIKGYVYSVFLDAPGYAYATLNTTPSLPLNHLSFGLLPENSINITIVEEITGLSIINETINIVLASDNSLYNYSTITGNYLVQAITEGAYIITLSSANYSTRTYAVTVTNRSTQSLTARLLNNTNSIAIGIYTKTQTSLVLPNVLYTIQRQYGGGSFATILQGYTDVSGFATFNLQSGTNYRVILSASGFNTKQFNQQFYLANSPYTFNLISTATSLYIHFLEGINYYYSPINTTLRNGTHTFQITTYNATYNIAWTAVNTNGTITNVSGSPGGATASRTVDLTQYTGIYTVIYMFNYQDLNTNAYETVSIPINYYIENRMTATTTLPQAMDSFKNDVGSAGWTAIISVFVILMAVVTIIQISGNLVAGVITGLSTMILFAFIGWISPSLVGAIAVIMVLSLYLNRGGY